jgi:hypothetical protein
LQLFSALDNANGDCVNERNYALVDWSVGFGIAHAERHGDELRPGLVASTGRVALAFLANRTGSGYFPVTAAEELAARARLEPVHGVEPIRLTLHLLYAEGTRKREYLDLIRKPLQ